MVGLKIHIQDWVPFSLAHCVDRSCFIPWLSISTVTEMGHYIRSNYSEIIIGYGSDGIGMCKKCGLYIYNNYNKICVL